MQLTTITSTPASVAGTPSRWRKVGLLAGCLRQMDPREVRVSVCSLMCALPQGKIGLAYAMVKAVVAEPAGQATVSLLDAHVTFQRMSKQQGAGSQAARQRLLTGLLRRATREEQAYLQRLMLGELRQDALQGLMIEAIGKAAELPAEMVRRAVMLTGSPAEVAVATMQEGGTGLQRFSLQLFRPLRPMLARAAEDTGDVLPQVGRAALEYKLDGARVQVHKLGDETMVFARQINDAAQFPGRLG